MAAARRWSDVWSASDVAWRCVAVGWRGAAVGSGRDGLHRRPATHRRWRLRAARAAAWHERGAPMRPTAAPTVQRCARLARAARAASYSHCCSDPCCRHAIAPRMVMLTRGAGAVSGEDLLTNGSRHPSASA
eukprot:325189-Rhodomonas_salina.1